MKKLLLLIPIATIAAIKSPLILSWDYPPEELPRMGFNVWYNTNLATTNWFLYTNVFAVTSTPVPVWGPQNYWYVTATNEFGEQVPTNLPSNSATGIVSRIINTLKLK